MRVLRVIVSTLVGYDIRRYYGAILPSLFVVTGGVGFCVLGCILGGQALASIANLSWT